MGGCTRASRLFSRYSRAPCPQPGGAGTSRPTSAPEGWSRLRHANPKSLLAYQAFPPPRPALWPLTLLPTRVDPPSTLSSTIRSLLRSNSPPDFSTWSVYVYSTLASPGSQERAARGVCRACSLPKVTLEVQSVCPPLIPTPRSNSTNFGQYSICGGHSHPMAPLAFLYVTSGLGS